MKLKSLGKSTLKAEVTQITPNGIWILVKGVEYFLSYQAFPWFEKGTVAQVHNVQLLSECHLFWPDLDVDLHVESLKNIEQYPLVYV